MLNDNYYKQSIEGLLMILEYKGVISGREYVHLMKGHLKNDDRDFISESIMQIFKVLRDKDILSRKEYRQLMKTKVWETDELLEYWDKKNSGRGWL